MTKKVSAINDNDYYGKNVRVPLNEYNMVKSFVRKAGYTMGGFFAVAAMEKMERIAKIKKK
jgi:uncharacterized protein YunC (DUF1805 family)